MDRREEVRDFYERMPYPAPLTSLDEHRDLYKNRDRRRTEFHLIWPAKKPRENQEILIAGCGTSQAARYALREPDARNHGDRRKRHEPSPHPRSSAQVQSGEFRIASTPDRARPGDRWLFRSGGLYGSAAPLPDPDYGLRALRDVLRPSGAMRLMVYARYGRTGIYMLQEYCRLLDINASVTDLRSLGAVLKVLPADHPISGLLRRSKDFWRPEAMADALLHPQDRAYTVPEMYAWLDRCGMSFGGWIEQAPYLAQCGLLASSPDALRLASLPSRSQHAAVELFRGTMVSTVSPRTGTIAPTRASRSAWPAIVGATTSPFHSHGRCAFGSVCLLVASRC